MTIQVKNKNLTKSLFQKSIFSRSNPREIPVFFEKLWDICEIFQKNLKNGLTNVKNGYILRTWSAKQGDDRTKVAG